MQCNKKKSHKKTFYGSYHELLFIFKKTLQCHNDHKFRTLPINPYGFSPCI